MILGVVPSARLGRCECSLMSSNITVFKQRKSFVRKRFVKIIMA